MVRTRLASSLFSLAVGFSISCAGGSAPTRADEVELGPAHDRCVAAEFDGCVDHAEAALQLSNAAGRRSALVAYQYGCAHGHAESCAGVARLMGDNETRRQEARLIEALRRSCDAGEPASCVDLAETLPRAEAEPLLRAACDAGEGRGCHRLAELRRGSFRFASQAGDALSLDERACELGAVEGCVAAGQAYLFGSGVEKDERRGLELLESGCNENVGASCETLARLYREGIGVPHDVARAETYEALEERHAATLEGFDGPELAFAIASEACARGDALGCYTAGWYRSEGAEVQRNAVIAGEFFARACVLGVTSVCEP